MTLPAKAKLLAAFFVTTTLGAGLFVLHGCNSTPPVTGTLRPDAARSQKLMGLAAEEAANIAEADMRLTRQLNIADIQIAHGWPSDAQTTLASVRKTLGSPEAIKLNDHARISGWVSASQLSRRVNDLSGATLATDGAMHALDRIEDPARRCQYVMGLSNELQYIKGKPAAAELLTKAGPWTKSIDDVRLRRQALVAFSTALFNLDDFTGGQTMLRQESDAAWRSDVLAGMAQTAQPVQQVPIAEARYQVTTLSADSASAAAPVPAPTQPSFGKNLSFEQIFRNQKTSQTSRD